MNKYIRIKTQKMATTLHPKPVLKWVGGKSKIMDVILNAYPRKISDYYEPFVGGGSVLIAVLSAQKAGNITITGKVVAGDANVDLIDMYRAIKSQPDDLIEALSVLVSDFASAAADDRSALFYESRGAFNELCRRRDTKTFIKKSALFIFLNKTCFRGIYRTGPNGFNVPYGNPKTLTATTIFDESNLRAVSDLFQNVEFRAESFEVTLGKCVVKPGDFVYMDPPYVPVSKSSFVGYTRDGFGEALHTALFKMCADFGHLGVQFAMSNSHAVLSATDTFNDPSKFSVREVLCRRAINSRDPASQCLEVLISGQCPESGLSPRRIQSQSP